MTETKKCAKCRVDKPTDQYGHDGRTKDRLTYRCNDCRTNQPN